MSSSEVVDIVYTLSYTTTGERVLVQEQAVIRFTIDEVAKQRGITKIQHLVNETGLNYNTVHWLWTGRATRIDLRTLDTICRVLKAQPGELMVWVDDQEKEP